MKKLLSSLIIALVLFIVIIILLPIIVRGKSDKAVLKETLESFSAPIKSTDSIALLEESVDSGAIRLALIDKAEKSIDICYHTIKEGNYSASFFNHLFEAADRGVQIRILVDEMMGGLTYSTKRKLASYPNITLYLYEKMSIFRPWTINNRLHDKLFLIDSDYAITGGRNIADKLYGYDQKLISPVYDRDILIKRNDEVSIIDSMNSYFTTLLELKYVKELKAEKINTKPRFEVKQPPFEVDLSTVTSRFITPEWIIRISNPQGRMSKAPIIWDTLLELMGHAKKEVILQSPYIVTTAKQFKELKKIDAPLYYLTNSINTTPNAPAFSAYLVTKPALLKTGKIKEYNGIGSIHAKTILIDEDISIIGSFNLDPRSLYLDTESMYVIKNKELNQQLRTAMNHYAAEDTASSSKLKHIALYVLGVISFPFRMLA